MKPLNKAWLAPGWDSISVVARLRFLFWFSDSELSDHQHDDAEDPAPKCGEEEQSDQLRQELHGYPVPVASLGFCILPPYIGVDLAATPRVAP
jgi:hypothetical protein